MATLSLRLLGTAEEELAALTEGEVPHWAVQLYKTHGAGSPGRAPLSAAVHALGRELEHRAKRAAALLARAEEMGWVVEVRGHGLRLHTGLDPLTSELLLERAGVWTVARMLAPRDGAGRVLWDDPGPPPDLAAVIRRVRAEHPDPATERTLDLLRAELESTGDLGLAAEHLRARPLPDSGRDRLEEVERRAAEAGLVAGD